MSEEGDVASLIFGWTGTAIATFFYIVPIIPYLKLIKGEITVKEVPNLLLIFSFLNCILWSDYGMIENQFNVYFANALGGAITLIFITIFLIHLAKKRIVFALLYNLLLIGVVTGIYFLCFHVVPSKTTGIIANVFNVLMYAGPGEKIYTICKNGNYKLIPIWSTIGGLACSACWMTYGFYKHDFLLQLPNGLGCGSAIVQVVVYLVYRQKYKNKIASGTTEETAKIDGTE